ncbi:oxidoreductase [Gordonia spumicola]|uniref:Oxidoreductase n=1 Tax=Gordonia spumicola TaxID=589161 RepID=A0A7I9VCH5_9ACTN|nr:flavin reductase family protein [Gordonia spumicola]GEE03079.1 oxidoreductase [Gordonia spumicola]
MTAILARQAPSDHAALRRVFGQYPSGLVVVAALGPDGPAGIVASSFTSVSLDPPLVSVNIARTSTTLPVLRGVEDWGVSVLADDQSAVADLLRRPATERFDGIDWTSTDAGAVHIDGVAAGFHTRVHRIVPAGDHVIALLAVTNHFTSPESGPLVFHRSRFHRLEQENPS